MIKTRNYKNLIDGQWVHSSNEFVSRISPATSEVIANYAAGTKEDIDLAVRAARNAFDNGPWPRLTGTERSQILYKLAQLMKENEAYLAEMEAEEVGKPIRLARGDISGAIGLVEYAAALALQLHGESYNNIGQKHVAMVVKEPIGVIALITPWNFPGLIYCQKMPFALAAGCTVVVKPSEYTSGTTLEISRLAEEAGVPKGVINVVTGYGSVVGQPLIDHPLVDKISFTGSTVTGKKMMEAAAKDIKRISLELGGKSANIVFTDADLEDAMDGALFGVFFNQGECCCGTTRLLIEDSIADQFLEELVKRAKQLKVGYPLDEDADVGAMIHQDHMSKVLNYIEIGKQEGAHLITGGQRIQDNGYENGCFIEPTIFDRVAPEMRIFQEEIFGPVLSVTRFKTTEEAIALANDTIYGLASAVWTKNIDKAMIVTRELKSGTVWVNTIIDGPPQLPFGGYKASGFGREMGSVGLEEFTEMKSIVIHMGKRSPFFTKKN